MTRTSSEKSTARSKWYAAHIIILMRFKNGRQRTIPLYENIVLFRARSPEEAFRKAQQHGHASEGDTGGSLTWENRPTTRVFAGIRKIVECSVVSRLTSGTEVTHLQLNLKSTKDLTELVEYRPVTVSYEE